MPKRTKTPPRPPRVVQLGFTRSGLALVARCLEVAQTSGQLNDIDQNEAQRVLDRVQLAYGKLTGS